MFGRLWSVNLNKYKMLNQVKHKDKDLFTKRFM